MNDRVDVRIESIMRDTLDYEGRTIRGLAYYLETLIAQNDEIIGLLKPDGALDSPDAESYEHE